MPPASFIASHFATKAEYDLSLTMPPTEREAAERKALESREAPASLTCVAEGKRTASFEYGTSSPQDVACLATVVRVLLSYPKFARFCIDTMQAQPTPKKLVELLPELAIRFDLQREGVAVNEAFFKSMAQKLELRELSGVSALAEAEVDPQAEPLISGALTQLHREWSAEGEAERRMSMDPIAQALERFVPVPATASGDAASAPKVVVPGAGLGRGVWELALRGYDVLGLDRALMFVVISRFIFDELIASGRALPICPHLHEFVGPTNVVKADHLSRRILIPDADVLARARAASDPAGSDPAYLQRMVMRAASFEEVAKSPGGLGAFDAVTTVFYIDACGNLLGAIESAYKALKPGGVWINVGPLEFDGTGGAHSTPQTRLCADEIILVIQRHGFEMLEARMQECPYTLDTESMFVSVFSCVFFVARKL